MNARKSVYFVVPLIALVLMACRIGTVNLDRTLVTGSGTAKSEVRSVSNVGRVSLTGMGELEIIQGSEEGLTVEADDNILPYIETRMNGKVLEIGIQDGVQLRTKTPLRFTLKVKTLDRVSVSGSGNINASDLSVDSLALVISGSGNIKISKLNATTLEVHTSGSGNFDLGGKVQTQSVSVSGSGNYNAGNLSSQSADVTITGAGNMTVWASETLKVTVSGFGNVNYYGTPQVTQNITGGGSVKGLGAHQ